MRAKGGFWAGTSHKVVLLQDTLSQPFIEILNPGVPILEEGG